jgi:hypothetical protein
LLQNRRFASRCAAVKINSECQGLSRAILDIWIRAVVLNLSNGEVAYSGVTELTAGRANLLSCDKVHSNVTVLPGRSPSTKSRVFISSTTVDLKPHRRVVREAIRKLGAEDIAMEAFGARDGRPLPECQRILREETDLFVGIYGNRYGFIPEGSSISITEAEYRAATEYGIPRLIFIKREPSGSTAPSENSAVTGGCSALVEFKKRLVLDHTCEFFKGPQDLATAVAASSAVNC